ncbi:ornithine aminomutase subunit alpha [Mycoplasmatota bacterium zrk1]
MSKVVRREDDFLNRRNELKNLSDKELKERFWKLANKIVDPLVDLAKNNTSPSIERSVLLRMGFSSIEIKQIVDKIIDLDLMKKGAGHVVYFISSKLGIPIHQAGMELVEGKHIDLLKEKF